MAIDFATFISIAPFIMDVRLPIMIRGRHGIGKSEVIYQLAASRGLPVVERRCSQMTEGDLLGLPAANVVEIGGKRATTWDAPDWLLTACAKPVVLFLDEIDRATMEVRQGIFELTDSRKIAGVTLHPDTLIFGAVNGGEHGAQYQVNEPDAAELSRWEVYDISPTVEDWLSWAKTTIDGLIWDFINQNRAHLEHAGDFEPSKVYPCRRSWKRLNDCLVKGRLLDKQHAPTVFNLACGFVGFEAASSLQKFMKDYERQVTVEDILDAGKVNKTKDFTVVDHAALVEKVMASGRMNEVLDAKTLQNVANYWITLPSEIAMKMFTQMGKANVKNSVALHGVEVNGKKCGLHLATMLGAKKQ